MPALTEDPEPEARHVLGELGLVLAAVGDELHGAAEVVAEMWATGTEHLRISVLVAWADSALGMLAVRVIAPRVPVTLELDIHLFEPIVGTPTIDCVARVVKTGSSVQVYGIDFAVAGKRVGFGHALFVAAPDPRLSMPTGDWALERFRTRRAVLSAPLAQRVECHRVTPGTATLPISPDVLNQARTLNGGVLAIAVEEAVLSLAADPTSLTSMQLRYLRPVRAGAVATADLVNGLSEVEVRDAESGALALLATTRLAST